ncbi:DUF4164 domain-containing protein [Roseibium aestuarii]|uniref:DUF4164 domain-containing protein n=1 Tax=Roseibium aestuarii TaxID=2600299 RepID=A0ABW4JW31_9HYPH|nr:DUF4164 domain-containing protein [Roseibium aestuarii]
MADTGFQAELSIESALDRLIKAVDGLEGAVDRRLKADHSLSSLQEDLQRLSEDRSDLANRLDHVQARADRLSDANRDVSRRLVTAMETIRGVLNVHGG